MIRSFIICICNTCIWKKMMKAIIYRLPTKWKLWEEKWSLGQQQAVDWHSAHTCDRPSHFTSDSLGHLHYIPVRHFLFSWELASHTWSLEWSNGKGLRLVIERSGFDSQRQQSSLIRLWCAIHPKRELKGPKIPEVHCVFAHPTCSLKIPNCLFAKCGA